MKVRSVICVLLVLVMLGSIVSSALAVKIYYPVYVDWHKWINPNAPKYLSNLNVIVHSSSKVELDTAN